MSTTHRSGNHGEPQLVARDGDLWAFAKPSGMPTHVTGDPARLDLMRWAQRELGAPESLAPVHRLDAGTSGIVLASPSSALRGSLGRAFADRTVSKVYRALVFGATSSDGRITKPLSDDRRRAPLDATTRYKCLAWIRRYSYLELYPETGRKHQLRRHLQHIKHPIVGDTRYRLPARPRPKKAPKRLWLHAWSITLPDARTFYAPLAQELVDHLTQIGGTAHIDSGTVAP